jgi:hypothetical protein
VALEKPIFHPFNIDIDTTLPPILINLLLSTIAPNDFIVLVAEERGVGIDKVN